jgi:hypothetical protein
VAGKGGFGSRSVLEPASVLASGLAFWLQVALGNLLALDEFGPELAFGAALGLAFWLALGLEFGSQLLFDPALGPAS